MKVVRKEQIKLLEDALRPLAKFGLIMEPGEYMQDMSGQRIYGNDTERAREALRHLTPRKRGKK